MGEPGNGLDRNSETPLSRQLAAILRQRILSGEIPPGRPVPSKRWLVQEYGVAGSTIDKAMRILKAEGLIRASPGLGLFAVPEGERPA